MYKILNVDPGACNEVIIVKLHLYIIIRAHNINCASLVGNPPCKGLLKFLSITIGIVKLQTNEACSFRNSRNIVLR